MCSRGVLARNMSLETLSGWKLFFTDLTAASKVLGSGYS